MQYNLKLYDEILLSFNYKKSNTKLKLEQALKGKNIDSTQIQDIIKINYISNNHKLLPFSATEDIEKNLLKWLKERKIPKNREHVDQILSAYNLSHADVLEVLSITKGLSLNDSYWLCEHDFNGSFDEYNLYDNDFNETLALLAFTGHNITQNKDFVSSPEFTTNGMLKKAWRKIDGEIYLYKGGTSGACNTGKEPYSEFYASQIAKQMGLNHINYDLIKWKDELCSVCKLFTSKNISYIPIFKYVKNMEFLNIFQYMKNISEEIYRNFLDMVLLDALICNVDRHYGNFGFLVDSHTNEILGFAPLFDHGMSLFNLALDNELKEDIFKVQRPHYYDEYKFEDFMLFMEQDQKNKLKKMINFTFTKHEYYNLENKRLHLLEKLMQYRVRQLLSCFRDAKLENK